MTTRTRPSCRATPPDPKGPAVRRIAHAGPFPRGRPPDRGPAFIHATSSIIPLPHGEGRARQGRARRRRTQYGEHHSHRRRRPPLASTGAGTSPAVAVAGLLAMAGASLLAAVTRTRRHGADPDGLTAD